MLGFLPLRGSTAGLDPHGTCVPGSTQHTLTLGLPLSLWPWWPIQVMAKCAPCVGGPQLVYPPMHTWSGATSGQQGEPLL